MSAAAFDTLEAARELEAAGIERHQAEAIVSVQREAGEPLATKSDLDTAIPTLRADIFRALWIQGLASLPSLAGSSPSPRV